MWHYQLVQHKTHVSLIEIVEIEGNILYTEDLMIWENKSDALHDLDMIKEDIENYPIVRVEDLPK